MDPSKTFDLMKSIITDGKSHCVTEATRLEVLKTTGVDLALIGIKIMPNNTAEPTPDAKDRVLACVTLEDGEELMLPDNKTGICGWGCGRTVQFRPEHPDWLTKACLHCINDRPTQGHS